MICAEKYFSIVVPHQSLFHFLFKLQHITLASMCRISSLYHIHDPSCIKRSQRSSLENTVCFSKNSCQPMSGRPPELNAFLSRLDLVKPKTCERQKGALRVNLFFNFFAFRILHRLLSNLPVDWMEQSKVWMHPVQFTSNSYSKQSSVKTGQCSEQTGAS